MGKQLAATPKQEEKTIFDMRILYEVKEKFGVCLIECQSLDDYMAALFERTSTETLKGALQLSGDTFDGLLETELRKREVHV